VEFNERLTCPIFQLARDVRKAFLPKQDRRSKHKNSEIEIRLVYHGRILLDDGTLESNCIRTGDTIVAMVNEENSDDSDRDALKKAINVPVNPLMTPDIAALIIGQQDTMKNVAQEMR
jgi:hypothetical protein